MTFWWQQTYIAATLSLFLAHLIQFNIKVVVTVVMGMILTFFPAKTSEFTQFYTQDLILNIYCRVFNTLLWFFYREHKTVKIPFI